MRHRLRRCLLAIAISCAGLAFIGVAIAAPPTPDAATATPAASAPTPFATKTPVAAMRLGGSVWINARPGGAHVRALIGDVECASVDAIVAVDAGGPFALLSIPSAGDRAGCGTPGAIVHFTIDGMPANETVAWVPGNGFTSMTFTAGPSFALFNGTYIMSSIEDRRVVPLIGNTVCGTQLNPPQGLGPQWGYFVVVDPSALQAGCGVPGAVVRFRLDLYRQDGSVVPLAFADQTAVWQPNGNAALNLTFSPRETLPSTGIGSGATGSPLVAAASLAIIGLLFVVAGVASQAATSRPQPGPTAPFL